jgi:hypothetical protein
MPNQNSNTDLLDQLGGEPLEGSGFETEIPESYSELRSPWMIATT